MPSLYIEGEVILPEGGEYEDFAWCTSSELKKFLPANLFARIEHLTKDIRTEQ
jgi:hypothetical protein